MQWEVCSSNSKQRKNIMSSTHFSMSERVRASLLFFQCVFFFLLLFFSSHCLTWFQFIVYCALDENPNNYKFSIHFNHCRRRRWRPTHETHVCTYTSNGILCERAIKKMNKIALAANIWFISSKFTGKKIRGNEYDRMRSKEIKIHTHTHKEKEWIGKKGRRWKMR